MTVSREEFARIATEFLRAQGEARPIVFDGPRFRLLVGEPEDRLSFAYLGHAYGEYLEAPEARDKVLISRLWTVIRRAGVASKEALFRAIVPRIRDRAWFSALRRQAELELGADESAIDDVMLPHHVVNDELAVHLAYELPTSVMELGNDRLSAWSVTFDELHAKALDNLRARTTRAFEQPEPGVYVSPYRDSLDATRLVLPELFDKLALKGRPVVIAPTHDILLVTGDDDAQGLTHLATWAEEALLEPRAHSAIAFRKDEGGTWKAWLPAPTHAAYTKLRLLALQTVASVYARQKEVLEALLEANGHDIFVANLRAFRAPTGDIFTSAAWTEGVEALLPQTDRLEFVRLPPDGDSKNATVWSTSWEVAQRTVGELMEATGDVPERFLVKGFPTDEQLERMAAEGKL